jgi:hypothetical protein
VIFVTLDQIIEIIRLALLIISSIAIPLTIFLVGNKVTRIRELEEKLRSDRIDIYFKILEPYFLLYSTDAQIKATMKFKKKEKDKTNIELATEKLLSIDFENYAFKLSLIGSCAVIRSLNNLRQFAYSISSIESNEEAGKKTIYLMSLLLLEIRKGVGIEKTKLQPFEILEWKITDIRKYKVMGKYPTY